MLNTGLKSVWKSLFSPLNNEKEAPWPVHKKIEKFDNYFEITQYIAKVYQVQ